MQESSLLLELCLFNHVSHKDWVLVLRWLFKSTLIECKLPSGPLSIKLGYKNSCDIKFPWSSFFVLCAFSVLYHFVFMYCVYVVDRDFSQLTSLSMCEIERFVFIQTPQKFKVQCEIQDSCPFWWCNWEVFNISWTNLFLMCPGRIDIVGVHKRSKG